MSDPIWSVQLKEHRSNEDGDDDGDEDVDEDEDFGWQIDRAAALFTA